MNLSILKTEIEQMENAWHKLLFLYQFKFTHEQYEQFGLKIEVLNINLLLSEALINIPKNKYPFYVEEIVQNLIYDQSKIYLLQHIDILFDPVLQINPIRLLENISKRNKIMVIWPGEFKNGTLKYAESGHPEYFVCSDFTGKVIIN